MVMLLLGYDRQVFIKNKSEKEIKTDFMTTIKE